MTMLIGLLLVAQAATGASGGPITRQPRPDKLICIAPQPLGTRLPGQRICRTKAEWDQDRKDMRVDVEKAQITSYH